MADAALKSEWRERFEFFERYGASYSSGARAAFKAVVAAPAQALQPAWMLRAVAEYRLHNISARRQASDCADTA